jgi:hypothetical protein
MRKSIRTYFHNPIQYSLRGEVGGGWALEFESFLVPVKWHRADRRVIFGAQKTEGGGGAGE